VPEIRETHGKDKILGTMHTYAMLAEARKSAASEWNRARAPQAPPAGVECFDARQRG
jgi:hypothetical protein